MSNCPLPVQSGLYLGLISGTSMDGIDAVLLSIDGLKAQTLAATTVKYPHALRAHLLDLIISDRQVTLHEVATLNIAVGQHFAAAAVQLLSEQSVAADAVVALGSHGQTIKHHPRGATAYTWQIGDAATIAARTGITTVADFRSLDIAYGGEGAPLVPPFHAWSFHSRDHARAVVNIGGITNVTELAPDMARATAGYDTGPGNCLLDLWCQAHRGSPFDADGAWAATGAVIQPLLERLSAHDYFALPAPKSTGRELFNLQYLQRCIDETGNSSMAPADVQATLLELTVQTLAHELNTRVSADEIYICGGGAYNVAMMSRLKQSVHARVLETTAALGIEPDMVEAAAFAWLAAMRVAGQPIPLTTGATPSALILGAVYRPSQLAR